MSRSAHETHEKHEYLAGISFRVLRVFSGQKMPGTHTTAVESFNLVLQ
jgi:hypothetical protein